jgi:hypothetical protein
LSKDLIWRYYLDYTTTESIVTTITMGTITGITTGIIMVTTVIAVADVQDIGDK